jgi:hypothetical protein
MATLPIVDTIDKRKGVITSIVTMILLILFLFLVKFEMADPPPQDIDVQLAEPLDVTVIENLTIAGGSGGGSPSDDPVRENQPQTENILASTKPQDSQTNTGQANTTNNPNSQNDPSTSQQSNNPFASGGSGNGDSGGDGDTFGGDSGTGTGGNGGGGTGKGRVRLNDVNIANLVYNSDEKIYLKLVIDAQGNVVQVINLKGKTTTTDQILINKVKVAVKKQVKYNKESGAPLVAVYYTVKINAQ